MATKTKIPQLVGPAPGVSGPVAAMVDQQQQMNEQYNKLLKTMQQMQEENQAQVEAAAQAGASGATQVANQVAQGLERQQQEGARQEERSEDKAFAEHMQKLSADLKAKALKEARVMGAEAAALRQRQIQYIESYQTKQNDHRMSLAAFRGRTLDLSGRGAFASERGREIMRQREWLANTADAMGEDHFDDRHLEELMNSFDADMVSLLSGGEADDSDISAMTVDPIYLPMGQVPSGGRATAPQGSISPDDMFDLKMSEGYPSNGIFFSGGDNNGVPPGYSPKMLTAKSMWKLLESADRQAMMLDTSKRQELDFEMAKMSLKTRDTIKGLLDTYKLANKSLNPLATGAVRKSLETFFADEDSSKYGNMPRYLLSESLKEIFGGTPQAEQLALRAMQMFDGKWEARSAQDLTMAMFIESAAFNLKDALSQELMGDEAGALSSNMIAQMEAAGMNEEEIFSVFGAPVGAIGRVSLQEVVQDRIAGVWRMAAQMHTGAWNMAAPTQLREAWGAVLREQDLQVYRHTLEAEDNTKRANHLLQLRPEGEVATALSKEIMEGPGFRGQEAMEELQPSQSEMAQFKPLLSEIQLAVQLGQELGMRPLETVSAFATGGIKAPESQNLRAYRKMRLDEEGRSPATKSLTGVVGSQLNRQKEGKRRESAGESYESGGVPGVIWNQFPPLMEYAAERAGSAYSAVGRGAAALGAGAVQAAGGAGAKRRFQSGLENIGEAVNKPWFEGPAPGPTSSGGNQ